MKNFTKKLTLFCKYKSSVFQTGVKKLSFGKLLFLLILRNFFRSENFGWEKNLGRNFSLWVNQVIPSSITHSTPIHSAEVNNCFPIGPTWLDCFTYLYLGIKCFCIRTLWGLHVACSYTMFGKQILVCLYFILKFSS